MTVEWLVADVTSVRSPARAEHDIFGVILGVFWQTQDLLVVKEPLCDDNFA